MVVKLNDFQRNEFEELSRINMLNTMILELYSAYLNNEPRLVQADLVKSLSAECAVSETEAFCAILSAAFGLDSEESVTDERLEREYIRRSVRRLDKAEFAENPYYKNIRIPEIKQGDWELKYECFEPYEGLIFDDLIIDGDYEIPCLGYFGETFVFPAVLEKGREWMMITPNEINTMKEPIEKMRGKVVTFGLGMGYFTYMASLKESVESITVVEKNRDVIVLFEKHILPQFENKNKIKIVCADAFKYAENTMSKENFDCAFVDIWHDALDGLDLYVKMKKLEKYSSGTEFVYWVERTLLSVLRRMVFEQFELCDGMCENAQITELSRVRHMLSDEYLRALAADIRKL